MDALVNDKPDFVRLFVDNGVNLGEFLTYGRLQKLYWSVSEKSLLHNLLLKKYEEKQLLLGAARKSYPPGHHPPEQGDRKSRFTLFEVAKVLKDFLHDSCKGFYQKVPTVSNAPCRRRFCGDDVCTALSKTSFHILMDGVASRNGLHGASHPFYLCDSWKYIFAHPVLHVCTHR